MAIRPLRYTPAERRFQFAQIWIIFCAGVLLLLCMGVFGPSKRDLLTFNNLARSHKGRESVQVPPSPKVCATGSIEELPVQKQKSPADARLFVTVRDRSLWSISGHRQRFYGWQELFKFYFTHGSDLMVRQQVEVTFSHLYRGVPKNLRNRLDINTAH